MHVALEVEGFLTTEAGAGSVCGIRDTSLEHDVIRWNRHHFV